jgi:succinyl-CoA synthetase beta subunit
MTKAEDSAVKIHEFQAKEIMRRYGIPIPPGEVATTPEQASEIAARIGGRVALKAQVLVGGRGKAGGVKLANSPEEAAAKAAAILGMDIKGVTVRKILVMAAVSIAQEIYLGAVLDRAAKAVTFMCSAAGGVEIEEVARVSPEKVIRVSADPFLGMGDYQARQLAFGIGLPANLVGDFVAIAKGLYATFMACDASLAEINPLVITTDGMLTALDGKIVLDDNALYRHQELAQLRNLDEEAPYERLAREAELNYVKLDGNIGCVVNGAGLAMATMDIIQLCGGSPANFLDVAGGARAEKVAVALRIILSDKNVKAVLFNIFGGITRCDEVARGIDLATREVGATQTLPPMVIRLVGTNETEACTLLNSCGMSTTTSLQEAAQQVVAAARG